MGGRRGAAWVCELGRGTAGGGARGAAYSQPAAAVGASQVLAIALVKLRLCFAVTIAVAMAVAIATATAVALQRVLLPAMTGNGVFHHNLIFGMC